MQFFDWHRYNTLIFALSVPLRTEYVCLYYCLPVYHTFSSHWHNAWFHSGFNQPSCHQIEDIEDSVFNQYNTLLFASSVSLELNMSLYIIVYMYIILLVVIDILLCFTLGLISLGTTN